MLVNIKVGAFTVKSKLILITPILISLSTLIFGASISHASELVKINKVCGEASNKKNKAYSNNLLGLIDEKGIAIVEVFYIPKV